MVIVEEMYLEAMNFIIKMGREFFYMKQRKYMNGTMKTEDFQISTKEKKKDIIMIITRNLYDIQMKMEKLLKIVKNFLKFYVNTKMRRECLL